MLQLALPGGLRGRIFAENAPVKQQRGPAGNLLPQIRQAEKFALFLREWSLREPYTRDY